MISIDILPDDVLLGVFDFCATEHPSTKKEIEAWQKLVHVCRRWRSVVFGSPRRLKLRLVSTPGTPTSVLDVWPALPLIVWDGQCLINDLDNVITLLEHSSRVCQVKLKRIPNSHYLETVLVAMQEPFPELTDLELGSFHETMPVLPDTFLGGSAPRLRNLSLGHIPFPGLPKLLLSATRLVELHLFNIPYTGYFSPEAMLTALFTLTSLRSLTLEFKSPQPHPNTASRPLLLPARHILPVLTSLRYKGISEYLDDLVAQIDAPRLSTLYITFFDQIVFSTSQLVQFVRCAPRLKALEEACVTFECDAVRINFSTQRSGYRGLNVGILCMGLDEQVSSLELVFTSSLPPLSMIEDLYIIEATYMQLDWQDNFEETPWLGLLHPFIAVKNLYLSKQCRPPIAFALRELVGGQATEVLPTLQNIYLEGLRPSGRVQKGIREFVAERQVTSHPITVTRWKRYENEGDDEEDDDDDEDGDEDEDEDD